MALSRRSQAWPLPSQRTPQAWPLLLASCLVSRVLQLAPASLEPALFHH